MAPRVILITGANSGVGYAITKVLASASADHHVIMTGRSLEKVEAAKSEIEAATDRPIKGTLSAVQLNVTDHASIAAAAHLVAERHGRLDVLINNAGLTSHDPDMQKRIDICMQTNLIGPAMVSEAFRPLLLGDGTATPVEQRQHKPYSIYISSGLGSIQGACTPVPASANIPFEDGYRTSKAALNMLAALESRKYTPRGLLTFAMCPGFVVSNLRGNEPGAKTGSGLAGDPIVSGETALGIIEGTRDQDAGKFVHKDGVYPW